MKYIISVIILICLLCVGVVCTNLTERRVSCCGESAASAILKSAIFSAQVQMKGGAYLDIDGNGVGEYGFIEHLSGNEAILAADGSVVKAAGDIKFITGPLADEINGIGYAESNKYYFLMLLPDGRGGMYDYDAYLRDPDKKRGAPLREKHFLALAWPKVFNEAGRRIFVMMEDGQLRTTNLVAVRDAFIKNPDWRHLYKGRKGTFEEILNQGPNEDWPYYPK